MVGDVKLAKCYHKIAKRGIEQLVKVVKGKKADDTELRTIHEMREIYESNDIKMMKVYVLGEADKMDVVESIVILFLILSYQKTF